MEIQFPSMTVDYKAIVIGDQREIPLISIQIFRPYGDSISINDKRCDSNAESTKTKWIEPDMKRCLENPSSSADNFPLISKAHPVKVLVSEGEMLYIPSLWYHRVTQTTETIGINYWYDMKFDSPHWCYFNFLQNLKERDMNLSENKNT